MTNTIQGSAKIYQFPLRRLGLGGQRPGQAASQTPAPQVKVLASSGWYHDAAIEDARRSGKH